MTLASSRAWLAGHYFPLALACFWLSFLLLPTSKAVNDVFYALVALPGLFLVARRWRRLPWRDAGFLLFIGWLSYGAASAVAWGPASPDRLKDVLYVFLFHSVVILAVDASYWRAAGLRRAAFWLALGYVLISCLHLWSSGAYAFGERILWLPARMTGPIYTSMFLVSLWALAVDDWLQRRQYVELGLAAALLLFCVIEGLQSRSGVVGFAAVVAILILRWRPLAGLGTFAALALAGVLLGLSGGLETIQSWSFIARADSLRLELWGKVLGEWQGCGWLLGCGYGHVIQATLTNAMPIAHAHNIFVAQALLGGLIGVLLLAAMVVRALLCGWRHDAAWALCLAAGTVMLNFDGSRLIGNPDELWLLFHWPLAVLIALNSQRRPLAAQATAAEATAARV